jgi:hypothetical protein
MSINWKGSFFVVACLLSITSALGSHPLAALTSCSFYDALPRSLGLGQWAGGIERDGPQALSRPTSNLLPSTTPATPPVDPPGWALGSTLTPTGHDGGTGTSSALSHSEQHLRAMEVALARRAQTPPLGAVRSPVRGARGDSPLRGAPHTPGAGRTGMHGRYVPPKDYS